MTNSFLNKQFFQDSQLAKTFEKSPSKTCGFECVQFKDPQLEMFEEMKQCWAHS